MKLIKILNKLKVLAVVIYLKLFQLPNKSPLKKNALIKLDSIGDYLLIRNFFPVLKKHFNEKNEEFVLIGNSAWKDLFTEIDAHTVDDVIWVDKKSLFKDFKYTLDFFKQNFNETYRAVILPTYSRDSISAFLQFLISAKNKTAYQGDSINASRALLSFLDKFNSENILSSQEFEFEFYRNKTFFEKTLKVDCKSVDMSVPVRAVSGRFQLKSPYVILFIGANADFRKWDEDHYATLAKNLLTRYQIVLCGGESELSGAKRFAISMGENPFINLVGQTSFSDMIGLINDAELVISNETSIPHLCAGLKKTVVVISNGNHYKRFSPYPSEMQLPHYTIYPDQIDNNDPTKNCQLFYYGSSLNINEVQPDKVLNFLSPIVNPETTI